MTIEELERLPENGGIGYLELSCGVNIPYVLPIRALYQKPEDVVFFEDHEGMSWTTGWHNSVLYKSRLF